MAFSDREFRDALGQFATGVVIVSAEVDGVLLGATISSFNSVSLDPPLVLFSLAHAAPSFPLWMKARHFGVTVLAEHQMHLSNRFARAGAEKWDGIVPLRGQHGIPLLPHGLATFECETYARYEGGDHQIIVARVLALTRSGAAPLLFFRGRYGRLHSDQQIETPPDVDYLLHGW